MKKFKIGEASKVLGMTNDTLRYYESKGIIVPKRDPESGYRYYDPWDMDYLLDSLGLRSYGFSVSAINHMINEDDLEQYIERCHKQEINLLHIIKEHQHKLKYLSECSHELKQIQKNLGVFRITESPALLFQERMRVSKEDEESQESEKVIAQSAQWTKHMPVVKHTFIVSLEENNGEISLNNLSWGFSLPVEEALNQRLDETPVVEYIPNLKCVQTVFYANEKGSFSECYINQVILPIKELGYKLIKSPIGRVLVKIHKDGRLTRYFETWVPIE